jgi:hypothetical protein
MKKLTTLLLLMMVGLNISACANQNNIQHIYDYSVLLEDNANKNLINAQGLELNQIDDTEKVINIYNEFLRGNIVVEEVDINYITIPTGEPDKRYETKYAFFDSNGDGIPELHINSGRYYYIFTVTGNDLIIWKLLSPNPPYYALDNGAFISRRYGSGPMSDEYFYIIVDFSGNEVFSLRFSKYDKNANGFYDKNDEYLFDGVSVTKEIWEGLTKRYFFTDATGIEQIRNEIEWVVLEN